MDRFDVIVIGAGAAGMMAAAEAGKRGRRVLIIDHNAAPGEKIRISGGGRCNFTNLDISPDRFLSQNPRFAISALRRFTQRDFISRLDRAGIAWQERDHGQLFCQGSARDVVTMLVNELDRAGVTSWLGCSVTGLRRAVEGFEVDTARGTLACASLVIATGGKSIPKMGATGFGYQIAQQFQLPIVETRPGLVPLTFSESDLAWMRPLAGIGLPARVSSGRTRFEEGLLFTHRGLSGPSILQISSYWREGQPISLDLAPDVDVAAELASSRTASGRQALRTALGRLLPERLARVVEDLEGESRSLAEMPRQALERASRRVKEWQLLPQGTEGYRTAEVTLGGVDTRALDGRRMEVLGIPGLFFIGEVVDVTGWLGGYNFQWAWSSGWVAGQVA